MRRVFQGLRSVLRVRHSRKCRTTCSVGSSSKAPSRQDKPGVDLHLHLKTTNQHVLLEMPRQESTTEFLTEIIKRSKAKEIWSQFFSESTASRWLSKYGFYKGTQSEQTVSVEEFDPLKHMNIEKPDTIVNATDCVDHPTCLDNGFAAMSTIDTLFPPNHPLHLSPSSDFLDHLANSNGGAGEPMEGGKQGITTGIEVPVGSKPASTREKFLRQCMAQREKDFTSVRDLKLFCGSWNVDNNSPPDDLKHWLLHDDVPPDIYALGFQELDLSKEAFIFMDTSRESDWLDKLTKCVNTKVPYKKVKSIRLVGILLVVFIQEKHENFISHIDSDSVATGIMGIMGNKGGVSVRVNVYNTSLCFIASHLAAHQDEIERRNSDYKDIFTKMRFKQFEPPLEIPEHDMVFWVGDLNYRIDMPIDDVKAKIKQRNYKELLQADQLYKEMNKGSDAFKGFKEGAPNFDPTFKYDPGTDTYDTSEKQRIPAWCDRILWRGEGITQVRFNSHPQLKMSDHRPVSSLLSLGIRVINPKQYKLVYEEVMKKLDRLENEYLPQIKLDKGKAECVFKDVKFIEPQSQTVTVANVGQVPVEFEFVNKLNDSSFCRPWLKVTPSKSVIQEGQCCEIHVEVYVDKTTVAKLNSGEEKLDDILVLHLMGGKDFFITVTGNYLASSFGSSIEALIQMHGPIRDVPVAELIEIEQPGSLSRVDIAQDGGRLYMVPKEIWKFIDFLHKNGSDKEELFQQPGRHSEIQFVRDCLDTGKPHCIPDTLNVHSVAESFLLFLECLAQPTIPYEFYRQSLASSNNLLLSKQLLTHLPDCHKNTFLYISAFLRELLKHSDKNGLTPKFLATMFGEVMLRQEPEHQIATKRKEPSAKEQRAKLREVEAKKAAFMHHFINHDIEL
ncbi:hypothetical protein BsWGS_13221 [Bradybaena similaris]